MRGVVVTLLAAACVGCQGASDRGARGGGPTPGPNASLEEQDAAEDALALEEEVDRLQALGYVDGSEAPQEGRVGVTVFDPERTSPGLNLVISAHGFVAALMDPSGQTLHTWHKDVAEAFPGRQPKATHFRRAHLFPNGDLLVLYARADGMVKLDRCSNVVWAAPNGAHHDFEVQPAGEIYALVRKAHVIPRLHPRKPALEDYVVVLSPTGEERQRVSLLDALTQSPFRHLWGKRKPRTGDLFHTNSVDVLRARVGTTPAFRPGRVLVSMRKLNLLALLDMEQARFVWAHRGSFRLQHAAQQLDNGHILLFDNRGLGRRSRILEIDAATGRTEWEYGEEERSSFYSKSRGQVERLPNGNTLITETDRGRVFEVTPDGETVWEYYNPGRAGAEDQLVAALPDVRRLPPGFPTDWIGSCPGP